MPPSLPRIDAIGNFHNLAKQQFEGCLATILVHLTTSHRRSCILNVQLIFEVYLKNCAYFQFIYTSGVEIDFRYAPKNELSQVIKG